MTTDIYITIILCYCVTILRVFKLPLLYRIDSLWLTFFLLLWYKPANEEKFFITSKFNNECNEKIFSYTLHITHFYFTVLSQLKIEYIFLDKWTKMWWISTFPYLSVVLLLTIQILFYDQRLACHVSACFILILVYKKELHQYFLYSNVVTVYEYFNFMYQMIWQNNYDRICKKPPESEKEKEINYQLSVISILISYYNVIRFMERSA